MLVEGRICTYPTVHNASNAGEYNAMFDLMPTHTHAKWVLYDDNTNMLMETTFSFFKGKNAGDLDQDPL